MDGKEQRIGELGILRPDVLEKFDIRYVVKLRFWIQLTIQDILSALSRSILRPSYRRCCASVEHYSCRDRTMIPIDRARSSTVPWLHMECKACV